MLLSESKFYKLENCAKRKINWWLLRLFSIKVLPHLNYLGATLGTYLVDIDLNQVMDILQVQIKYKQFYLKITFEWYSWC
jgi:hypothetical protein